VLTPLVAEAINKQVSNELFGAYVYTALNIYFDGIALPGFASWMAKQSIEELEHAEKLIRFLLDHDEAVTYEPVPTPPQTYTSIENALETVMEVETRNTSQIREIYHLASKNASHSVEILMRWFIEQQGFEEKFARDALQRVRLAGADKGALLVLDQQFGARNRS